MVHQFFLSHWCPRLVSYTCNTSSFYLTGVPAITCFCARFTPTVHFSHTHLMWVYYPSLLLFITCHMLHFCLPLLWFSVDSDVIHIDWQPSLHNFHLKYGVHHHLECGWGVGETKEHDSGLKEPLLGEESCFLLISFFDANVVISPSYIKLGEQGTSLEAINYLRNEGWHVAILLCPFVKGSVVLHWS